MDTLHTVLRAIRPQAKPAEANNLETKSASTAEHLTVFREFLAHLERIQRKAEQPRAKPARRKPPATRKPAKR